MEGVGKKVETVTLLIVILLITTIMSVEGDHLLKVGGQKGWNQNVNYTDWSSHTRFYIGDWLYFVFDKRYYDVLEVNETSYESCYDTEFLKNITRGGRDVYELKEARPYYFLSRGGYCYHGMKVAINVTTNQTSSLFSPAPAPAPSPLGPSKANAAASHFSIHTNSLVMLSIGLVWAVVFIEW